MHDPQFEATVAQIRGFDLGDDAELLAHLDARMASGLRGDEWLLRGVLLHRAGRPSEALECLDHAVEHRHALSRAHYLKSCILRDRGDLAEALEVLEKAHAAADEDGLLSAAELAHAQGLLFWQVGNGDEALRWIEKSLAEDEHSASRWLLRGQLLARLGRDDAAVEALERALTEEQDLDRAMYERAALAAKAKDVTATAEWLTKANRLDPKWRKEATADARFDGVRGELSLVALVTAPVPPSLGWLDSLAPWMAALRGESELETLGVRWLGRASSDDLGRALQADYEHGPLGTMHTAPTLARSRQLLFTRRVVAEGPSCRTREGVAEPCLLFVDVERPAEGLWLALSRSYPPFLWIRVEPRIEALRAVLAEYFPRPRRTRLDMPAQVRGFLGYRAQFLVPSPYARGLEPAGIAELDRHFAINPFVESASWGSAHEDDPWPEEIPDQPDLIPKITARQHLVSEQAPGHVWSLSRRTRHSRSYLTIEVHHQDIIVAHLRYRPSSSAGAVEAMNAHFGCDYPPDLPVDAVGALLGFQFDGARDLETQLPSAQDPEQLAGLLLVLSALRHGDLGVLELYRRYVDHPDPVVRSTMVDIAVAGNHEVLLEEMSLREPDPELRAEIETLLDEGIPMPEDDPYELDDEDAEELDESELEELPADDTVELDVGDVELERVSETGKEPPG